MEYSWCVQAEDVFTYYFTLKETEAAMFIA